MRSHFPSSRVVTSLTTFPRTMGIPSFCSNKSYGVGPKSKCSRNGNSMVQLLNGLSIHNTNTSHDHVLIQPLPVAYCLLPSLYSANERQPAPRSHPNRILSNHHRHARAPT